MPLQATSGAASYDAFGGGPPFEPVYIESVFSTYLYTGNGSTQTITNGIDLSTKGGLVWIKQRDGTANHTLTDTARGNNFQLFSNSDVAQANVTTRITAFNATGFDLGLSSAVNGSASTYASWTFRKQPKFFDVVTWTGNGTGSRAISHSLASTPGCIILKRTDAADDWYVVHRSAGNFADYGVLNTTAAIPPGGSGISSVGSTSFTVSSYYNGNGATWVAYVFAHDAGGFGLTGTDNVISCGSFTTDGSGVATVNLGYEPQWVMIKQSTSNSSSGGDWRISDVMRGASQTNSVSLWANLSDAEFNYSGMQIVTPTATGFNAQSLNGSETFIYIAIRRGPMKTPTSGTSVFTPTTRTGTGSTVTTTAAGFPVDTYFVRRKSFASFPNDFMDRLRGAPALVTNSTGAESTGNGQVTSWAAMSGVQLGGDGETNSSIAPNDYVDWYFRRAPGFFDVVCYTGTGTNTQTFNHNLGTTPELVIIKRRSSGSGQDMAWPVAVKGSGSDAYFSVPGAGGGLNLNGAFGLTTAWSGYFGAGLAINAITVRPYYVTWSSPGGYESGQTYVAYLFATVAGVSKVFSFTGNGSSQTINCGFTGGARFVMIKRTDSTGDWYVWDTARGIVANNDPHLSLNSTAAEVTTNDTIDTDSTGFVVNQVSATNVNVNGASYIGLAIA